MRKSLNVLKFNYSFTEKIVLFMKYNENLRFLIEKSNAKCCVAIIFRYTYSSLYFIYFHLPAIAVPISCLSVLCIVCNH